jgi:cell wall-associated NlpC family hydrolase
MQFSFPARRWTAAAILSAALCAQAGAKTVGQARNEILVQTMPYLNIPYLWGGTQPKTGLDCSAFVQLVYHRAGLNLPRVAKDQFAATRYLKPNKVLPGDLVFFSMHKPGSREVDHVGIYLGKGLFIHASVTNGVHVESIVKPYYLSRLVSVRKFSGF